MHDDYSWMNDPALRVRPPEDDRERARFWRCYFAGLVVVALMAMATGLLL